MLPRPRAVWSVLAALIGFWLNLSGFRSDILAAAVVAAIVGVICWSAWPAGAGALAEIRNRRHPLHDESPASAEGRQSDGYNALLPWVDEGQLVFVLRHKTDDLPERSTVPVGWWCEVTAPGEQTPAMVDGSENEHRPVRQRIEVHFPRDFRHAPPLPLRPGSYRVQWWQHLFSRGTGRKAGRRLIAERDFMLREDGSTWIS